MSTTAKLGRQPKASSANAKVPVNITVDRGKLRAIDRAARKANVSRSNYIVTAAYLAATKVPG